MAFSRDAGDRYQHSEDQAEKGIKRGAEGKEKNIFASMLLDRCNLFYRCRPCVEICHEAVDKFFPPPTLP